MRNSNRRDSPFYSPPFSSALGAIHSAEGLSAVPRTNNGKISRGQMEASFIHSTTRFLPFFLLLVENSPIHSIIKVEIKSYPDKDRIHSNLKIIPLDSLKFNFEKLKLWKFSNRFVRFYSLKFNFEKIVEILQSTRSIPLIRITIRNQTKIASIRIQKLFHWTPLNLISKRSWKFSNRLVRFH